MRYGMVDHQLGALHLYNSTNDDKMWFNVWSTCRYSCTNIRIIIVEGLTLYAMSSEALDYVEL